MGELFAKVLDELQEKPSTSGSLLRAFRKGLKLSQEDLEEITGIKSTNISALENDKLPLTGHYADIFAAALGIHPRVLLYPDGQFYKSAELKKIERRAQKIIKKKVG
ncbi:MAG: helix-turn-helix transcriptional regulator [Bdellovibrionales bacterium]|nr:helix-turn-helix transcriptional regulator [Bdellovibrionales bacterium]